MSRLIEIQASQCLPPSLAVCVGDLLLFESSGGYVQSGSEYLELLGAFLKSLMGTDQQVLSPLGAPNAVVFLARYPGIAEINVITGDPWHNPTTIAIEIIIS